MVSAMEISKTEEAILSDYKKNRQRIDLFSQEFKRLVTMLTSHLGGLIHSVSARVKTEESLRTKIHGNVKYHQLSDIQDVVGIRIITYFADDVDIVAEIIRNNLEIDEENSIDKRQKESPEQFGYMSLHYVASLGTTRLSLPEYNQYADMVAEIQIRSIVQHAWAEVEHDLGYKSELEIPYGIRRAFHRTSALLEEADLSFSAIRQELVSYEANVTGIIGRQADDFGNLGLDKLTVLNYIKHIKLVSAIDAKIAKKIESYVVPSGNGWESWFLTFVVPNRIRQLHLVGISKLSELHEGLKRHEGAIVSVGAAILSDGTDTSEITVAKGSCVFFLCYVLSALKGRAALLKYMKEAKFSEPPETHRSFASMIMRVIRKP